MAMKELNDVLLTIIIGESIAINAILAKNELVNESKSSTPTCKNCYINTNAPSVSQSISRSIMYSN